MEYKAIEGYEGYYEISRDGSVRGVKRPVKKWDGTRFIKPAPVKPFISGGGYCRICLSRDGTQKKYPVHRLVAKAFIQNPKNYPQINHRNGIKTDNRVENLEWCTQAQNNRHMYDVLGYKGSQAGKFGKLSARHDAVIQVGKDGHEVARFDSMMDAQREGFCANLISKCCNGLRAVHSGYFWRFADPARHDKVCFDTEWPMQSKRPTGGKHHNSKAVKQFDKGGNLVREWESPSDAAREGHSLGSIYACCSGRRKTHHGFKWEYAKH